VRTRELGTRYEDGQEIVRQGDAGDCMFVVLGGKVEVVQEREGREVHLSDLGQGELFGEMSLFCGEPRSATVRAKGDASVLTVDRRTLLGHIQQDPTVAFNVIEALAGRLRHLNDLYARIRAGDRRNWETRPVHFDRD